MRVAPSKGFGAPAQSTRQRPIDMTEAQGNELNWRLDRYLVLHGDALSALGWHRFRTDGRGCLVLFGDQESDELMPVEYCSRSRLDELGLYYERLHRLIRGYRADRESVICLRVVWPGVGPRCAARLLLL